MTWEELKQEAKKMGATIDIRPYGDRFERIEYKNIILNSHGDVAVVGTVFDIDTIVTLAKHRTTNQMYQIMKAL